MKSLTTFTRAWYGQEFLRQLVLIYPVYAIMIGQAGVSPLELSILFMAWSATGIVCEIPTGTLADRLPRRWILVAGQLLKASCFLFWWLEPSFFGFLAGFVAWGLGGSLRSGAAEALLHDALAQHGRPERFVAIYGRGEAAGATAVVVAMAVGGWAAETGFTLPLLLSIGGPLAASLITILFIAEPARNTAAASHESYFETLKAGLREVRGSAALRRPILYLCTLALGYEVGEEYFGPLLDAVGFPLVAVGAIGALANVARAAGAFVAERLRATSRRGVLALYAAGGLFVGLAALSRGWLAMVSLILFVALTAAASVLLQARLQHSIAGHARATITSVVGLGQGLVGLPLYLALGAAAQRAGWTASFVMVAVGMILAAALFALSSGRDAKVA